MHPITKIVLHIIAAIMLTSMLACSPAIANHSNPEQVADAAFSIADLSLPAGYAPEFSASLGGYTLATYNGRDDPSHLYLIQSEKGADGEKLAAMLAEMAPGDSDAHMTVIETRAAVVRGQETTVAIIEGVNSEGMAYRQATVAFQGKGGPALLVFSEPVTRWNQETVDDLLASIY